ncbi:MAG: fluoride efflux transporter CrcB [Blastopirellula sp.]|nr:MAG: fluoride efflux transporter CrcB [Blastopirellula sp.]
MPDVLIKLALIGTFGAVGAMTRFGVNQLSIYLWGGNFPYGTLTVNILGCFLIGFISYLSANSELVSEHWRICLITGFLGALTTFSAFGLETYDLFEFSGYEKALLAAGNIAANVGLGLLAVVGGVSLARFFVGGG